MLVDQRFYVIHECDTIQLYDKGIYIYIYIERERERESLAVPNTLILFILSRY